SASSGPTTTPTAATRCATAPSTAALCTDHRVAAQRTRAARTRNRKMSRHARDTLVAFHFACGGARYVPSRARAREPCAKSTRCLRVRRARAPFLALELNALLASTRVKVGAGDAAGAQVVVSALPRRASEAATAVAHA